MRREELAIRCLCQRIRRDTTWCYPSSFRRDRIPAMGKHSSSIGFPIRLSNFGVYGPPLLPQAQIKLERWLEAIRKDKNNNCNYIKKKKTHQFKKCNRDILCLKKNSPAQKMHTKKNTQKEKKTTKKYLNLYFSIPDGCLSFWWPLILDPFCCMFVEKIPPFPVCMLPSIRLTHSRCQVIRAKCWPTQLHKQQVCNKICIYRLGKARETCTGSVG